MAYKYRLASRTFTRATSCPYAANFMRMMFATPCEEYTVNDVLVRAMDASSSCTQTTSRNASDVDGATVRFIGHQPLRRDRGRCRVSVGPGARRCQRSRARHAARHQRNGGVAKIGEFITKVKDKNSEVRLMGFGHRVYKHYDPRAKLMRETSTRY